MLVMCSSQCNTFFHMSDVDFVYIPVYSFVCGYVQCWLCAVPSAIPFFTCLMLILCKSQSTALCVDMFNVDYAQFPVQYLFSHV